MNVYALRSKHFDSDTIYHCVASAVNDAYKLSAEHNNTPVKVISTGYDVYQDRSYDVTVNVITAPKFDDEKLPTYEHLKNG